MCQTAVANVAGEDPASVDVYFAGELAGRGPTVRRHGAKKKLVDLARLAKGKLTAADENQ